MCNEVQDTSVKAENNSMRVLLYDHDQERNRRLHQHLEEDDIPVIAAYCLKDFLMKFEKKSLKVLLIEHTRIQHYNIDVEDILDRLGLTFTVIVYNESSTGFEFSTHYLQTYFYFPFTTEKDKELIKKVKYSLRKFKRRKAKERQIPDISTAAHPHDITIKNAMKHLSGKQRQLLTKLLEKKEGINVEEIVEVLNAQESKNKQNYAHSNIHRLRNKLYQVLGKEYIISYKNQIYQLLRVDP